MITTDKTPTIAITAINSIRVKPLWYNFWGCDQAIMLYNES